MSVRCKCSTRWRHRWLAMWLVALGLLAPFARSTFAAEPPVAAVAGRQLAPAIEQGEQLRLQVERWAAELQQLTFAQRQREQRASTAAREIEALKQQPAGVAHDLALNERLAVAQAQAAELATQAATLRQRSDELRAVRRRLLMTCDRILDSDQSGQLTASGRLGWLRLRTAQVEALLDDGSAASAQAVARGELAAMPGADADDPQLLRERADLLRDSADKLRREVDRLQARSDELQRRQKLRERASRVDEDLFAEQSTARRTSSRASFSGSNASLAPAADAVAGSAVPVASPTLSAPSRSGPDPATLDGLLRVDGGGDPAAKLQALARAQAELQGLAGELQRRANRLEQRASELGRQK